MTGAITSKRLGWYYDVKRVDRRFAYSVIEPTFVVCDVGGSIGRETTELAKRCAFIIDLDIDKGCLKEAKRVSKEYGLTSKIDCVRASATHLPFNHEVFCLVTCFSVLDHLPDKSAASKAICEFSRVTRKLGFVAVTVPNKHFLVGTISMKIKQGIEPDFKHYEQRFTPTELLRSLASCGLKTIAYDSKYPTSIGSEILNTNLPKFLKKIPCIMNLLSLGARVFFTVEKHQSFRLFGARMGYLSQKPILL
jgi:ubiquinone/menaquinone biosynthesis C-methylase UbiE